MSRAAGAWVAALLLAALVSRADGMGRRTPREAEGGTGMDAKSAAADVVPNEWRGSSCAESSPSARIIESGAEWDRLWRDSIKQPTPEVDFSKHLAVAIFLGSRPTGGFGVGFLEPLSNGIELVLRYKVRSPGPGAFVTQAFTQPYAAKLYKKTGMKVSLAEEK